MSNAYHFMAHLLGLLLLRCLHGTFLHFIKVCYKLIPQRYVYPTLYKIALPTPFILFLYCIFLCNTHHHLTLKHNKKQKKNFAFHVLPSQKFKYKNSTCSVQCSIPSAYNREYIVSHNQ